MSSENRQKAKPAKRQSVSQSFDLSQIETLRLVLADQQGNQVLVVELDRHTEDKPQLKLSTGFSKEGDLKSCLTLYDIDA